MTYSVRPRIFIGSASEDLDVVEVLVRRLSDIADVVPWTADEFKKPGDYFLDSLQSIASTFDLAIMVFGASDVTTSRGKTAPAPRDNVVFELGLFIALLGRPRSLVVVPRLEKEKIKILSDLEGLNLAPYDPPRGQARLEDSLEGVVRQLRAAIDEHRIRAYLRGPAGVAFVWTELEKLLAERARGRRLQNIALDLEQTWRFLHDSILVRKDRRGVRCRLLFIDHRSRAIRRVSSESVSVATARQQERKIVEFCEAEKQHLSERGIDFACRAYREVPVLHGFLVDGKHLYMSLTSVEDGRLVGAPNPYTAELKPKQPERDVVANHLISVFEGWFEHLWTTSRRVWPPEAAGA